MVPIQLRNEFVGFMEAFNEMAEDLPDGAWFSVLEEGAGKFIKMKKLKKCDENDAVHQFLEWRE